ncbi:MAG: 30S ribosomal protein S20 [Candidatus Kerfeldbacteria bacterium]|nr:30S ribosomal protein S20 [Candidatus Kerfeldbacteria bacterium]
MRKNAKQKTRNFRMKRTLKETIKSARTAIASKESNAKTLVVSASKLLDRAAQRNVIKKNTAARTKSRLQVALNRSTTSS